MSLVGIARWTPRFLAVAALLIGGRATAAPPAAPPPPKRYDVLIRYRIDAVGADRVAQYFAMTRYLGSVGFVIDPNFEEDPRDPYETRLPGTVPSAQTRLLLLDTRVKALLLTPAGYKRPEDENALVKVRLELASGFSLPRQRELADQVRPKLLQLGFREAVGYDNRGHARLLGLAPVASLDTLLKDLRWQPSGWLAPNTPEIELPEPLRNVSPILMTEVLPEPEGLPGPKGWGEPPERIDVADPTLKISPELRAAKGGEDGSAARRMEVILRHVPTEEDKTWRAGLRQAAPTLVLEGRLGPIVTVVGASGDAARLAALPDVSVVRLPRAAVASLQPAGLANLDFRDVRRVVGLDRLFERGYRGRGVRIGIVDGDFRGYERLRGKQLPAKVRLVDFTAERNGSILPDPFPGDPAGIGTGTQAAVAALLAAPEADVTLIRIDPAAPHQLAAVARLLDGERFFSDSIEQRTAELETDALNLRERRVELLRLRAATLNNFSTAEEDLKKRADYLKLEVEWNRAQKDLQDRRTRYFAILEAQQDLRNVRVVSSSLVWETGYPVGGLALTQFLNEHPPCAAFWFQSAGTGRGQAWAGLFRDADGNRVMEFAPPAPPADWWRKELNFLGWQPFGKERALDLPAGARLRLSVQWQEAHDPRFFDAVPDAYLRPLADLKLVILRQRDPSGTKVVADEFDVMARSAGLPQRLNSRPDSATYEQFVEFTADVAGRYAVRLEGRTPGRTQPEEAPRLPALERNWELWPRLFVEVVDDGSRQAGRAIFHDSATDLGSLGTPAGARALLTVGAADLAGAARPYSGSGPPYRRALLGKPNLLAPDRFPLGLGGNAQLYGGSLSAPFAAGLTATALSAGTPPPAWQRFLETTAGRMPRVP